MLCALIIAGLSACSAVTKGSEFQYQRDSSLQTLITTPVVYPRAPFIVFSDPHIFSTALWAESPALDEYLANDRKLLKESTKIMDAVVADISKEKVDFVLVSGDLTKDGERTDHELAADYLAQIEATGKQVYVVPGNHDIQNPRALSYDASGAKPVPSVTPEEFAQDIRGFWLQRGSLPGL